MSTNIYIRTRKIKTSDAGERFNMNLKSALDDLKSARNSLLNADKDKSISARQSSRLQYAEKQLHSIINELSDIK